jgi:F0F1-type ATP synthase assembly protein I
MPSDGKPNANEPANPELEKAKKYSTKATLAMELPFTFVGAVAVGGLIGYYLDKWLHTSPWLMVVFGGFGFVAGLLEIARRFAPADSGGNDDKHSV